MGYLNELSEKYSSLSMEKDKKEILKLFPRKEGKLLLPTQGKISIPRGKTLVFFNSCNLEASNDKILEKMEQSLSCRVISITETVNAYQKYHSSQELIDSIIEEEIIDSLEDGYITVIKDIFSDLLRRAILLRCFEEYYTRTVSITLDDSDEFQGSLIHDIIRSINHFNEDRKNKLRLGVDISYIVPCSLIDQIKIISVEEV
ncbi:MAG: hypothetical protein Q4D02_07460 [Clostridia bacterium]|nr:hypothetical protein [Clostridia bacterium]